MVVKNTSVQTTPEILKRKLGAEYLVPVTVTQFANGVCKAGSPIGADGTVQNGANAVGILLYDVYEQNPNGSLVKAFAVINKANAEANSGLTIAGAVETALPMVIFE
ncbi:MAG: hypothetical protein II291_01215 [Succinivibrio sp.]|nr:hypothetical protein [Succinivibrio sp.]